MRGLATPAFVLNTFPRMISRARKQTVRASIAGALACLLFFLAWFRAPSGAPAVIFLGHTASSNNSPVIHANFLITNNTRASVVIHHADIESYFGGFGEEPYPHPNRLQALASAPFGGSKTLKSGQVQPVSFFQHGDSRLSVAWSDAQGLRLRRAIAKIPWVSAHWTWPWGQTEYARSAVVPGRYHHTHKKGSPRNGPVSPPRGSSTGLLDPNDPKSWISTDMVWVCWHQGDGAVIDNSGLLDPATVETFKGRGMTGTITVRRETISQIQSKSVVNGTRRTLVVLPGHLDRAVELSLPLAGTIIYFYDGNHWEQFPPDAPLDPKKMILYPSATNRINYQLAFPGKTVDGPAFVWAFER